MVLPEEPRARDQARRAKAKVAAKAIGVEQGIQEVVPEQQADLRRADPERVHLQVVDRAWQQVKVADRVQAAEAGAEEEQAAVALRIFSRC